MDSLITIVDYRPAYQPGIADLLDGIQSEFPQSIYSRSTIASPEPRLWVALHNNIVVGMVGLLLIGDDNAVLKNMMVQKEYRGNALGLSKCLLGAALAYAAVENVRNIYLGTMTQFKAAQSFYKKHSFTMIERLELPKDFIINPVDDIFFMLHLNH
jgi:N-acetylglutamate synthase-like GNAT family acetyltransferase